jgi:hypothetical protein
MKRNLISATKVFGMIAFSCFVSFFVYISFFIIIRQISTDVTGYTVYEIDEQGAVHDIETVETAPNKAELGENRGYKEVRTDMPVAANVTMSVLQVVCGVGVVFCTAGAVIAKDAAKDRNNADFNSAVFDKYRGFKIGALAGIPSLFFYIITLILRFITVSDFSKTYFWLYRWIVMCPVKPINDLFTGNADILHAAPIWSIAVQVIFPLCIAAFCGIMYIICYNEDSFIAKVLYKSTRKKEKKQRRIG